MCAPLDMAGGQLIATDVVLGYNPVFFTYVHGNSTEPNVVEAMLATRTGWDATVGKSLAAQAERKTSINS